MTNAEWLTDIWDKHHKIVSVVVSILFILSVVIEIITKSEILVLFMCFLGFIFLALFTFEVITWLDEEHKEKNKE